MPTPIKTSESKARELFKLCGNILAMIQVNRAAGNLVCKDETEFDRILSAYQSRMKAEYPIENPFPNAIATLVTRIELLQANLGECADSSIEQERIAEMRQAIQILQEV